jgi:hypothetical protein
MFVGVLGLKEESESGSVLIFVGKPILSFSGGLFLTCRRAAGLGECSQLLAH